ncbi:MAG TPA: CsgG/HfaB family protein [Treponemataceae bacterium]|nr:CsgG/HfaB family protein [Treponemataceae bacterium]
MKRILFCAFSLLTAGFIQAQSVAIDGAIAGSVGKVESKLDAGTKIAVLNFKSPSPKMSDYVIEELVYRFVDSGKLAVIDRENINLLRDEMKFQLSGEVSDESAQSIGKFLGAQVVITGSIDDSFRFRIKAINVESARLLAVSSFDLARDAKTKFLLGNSSDAKSFPASRPSDSVPAVSPAQPSVTITYGSGNTADKPLKVPYRVITMRGNEKEWEGITPFAVAPEAQVAVNGIAGTEFQYLYICRDERNLYVRFDFASVNPLKKAANVRGRRLACSVDFILSDERNMYIQSYNDVQDVKIGTVSGIYDGRAKKSTDVTESFCSSRNSATCCEFKIPISLFSKLVANPFPIVAYVCQFDTDWKFTRFGDGIPLAYLTLE